MWSPGVGGHIARRLLGAGHHVTGVTRTAGAARRLRAVGAEAVPGNAHKPRSPTAAADAADAVIYAVAAGSFDADHAAVDALLHAAGRPVGPCCSPVGAPWSRTAPPASRRPRRGATCPPSQPMTACSSSPGATGERREEGGLGCEPKSYRPITWQTLATTDAGDQERARQSLQVSSSLVAAWGRGPGARRPTSRRAAEWRRPAGARPGVGGRLPPACAGSRARTGALLRRARPSP